MKTIIVITEDILYPTECYLITYYTVTYVLFYLILIKYFKCV